MRALTPLLLSLWLVSCVESHGLDADAGGAPLACTRSSECVVLPASCCGSCGAASRSDMIALNAAEADAYRRSACEGIGCPACEQDADPTLVPVCRSGRCEVLDVLADPVTECTSDAECALRTNDCCECGGDVSRGGLLAIRSDARSDYMDLVCDEGSATPCPECAPVLPEDAAAACDLGTGRCRALWAR